MRYINLFTLNYTYWITILCVLVHFNIVNERIHPCWTPKIYSSIIGIQTCRLIRKRWIHIIYNLFHTHLICSPSLRKSVNTRKPIDDCLTVLLSFFAILDRTHPCWTPKVDFIIIFGIQMCWMIWKNRIHKIHNLFHTCLFYSSYWRKCYHCYLSQKLLLTGIIPVGHQKLMFSFFVWAFASLFANTELKNFFIPKTLLPLKRGFNIRLNCIDNLIFISDNHHL